MAKPQMSNKSFVIIFLAITFIFTSLTYRSYDAYTKLPEKGIATTATVEEALAGAVCGKPPAFYCLRLSYKTADGKNYTVNYIATKSFWNIYWNKFHNGDAAAPKPTTEIYYSPDNPIQVEAKLDKITEDLLFYAFFYVWTTGVIFTLYKKLTKPKSNEPSAPYKPSKLFIALLVILLTPVFLLIAFIIFEALKHWLTGSL